MVLHYIFRGKFYLEKKKAILEPRGYKGVQMFQWKWILYK